VPPRIEEVIFGVDPFGLERLVITLGIFVRYYDVLDGVGKEGWRGIDCDMLIERELVNQ
jgi:hypothetical protein